MKRKRLAVKLVKKMSASHARVLPDKRYDGTYGKCQASEDYFFFQQICDEVEGTYENKTVQ
jgi:hypothetical protein